MQIKKKYYSLKEKEFKDYLNKIKTDPETFVIFSYSKNPYFYYPEASVNNMLLKIHKLEMEFENIINGLSLPQKEMIKQSFIVDEIQSTNNTENIYSTKNDIFGITSNKQKIKNKKIVSIVNSYNTISSVNNKKLESNKTIRMLYDSMMKNAFENSKDIPDGKIYRKGPVSVMNGIKPVHKGFYPESEIIKGMDEYIKLLKNDEIDIYLKIVLSHFIIETVHPFYDGNGRFGRYLMSVFLCNNTNSLLSYTLATGINKEKKKYYKSLEDARDIHEFGCLNDYVFNMLSIISNNYTLIIEDIKEKLLFIKKNNNSLKSLTKSEKIIYSLLVDATYLTYFGICNEEIMKFTGISKKTLITCFNKLYKHNLIEDYKLSKTYFHKLKA